MTAAQVIQLDRCIETIAGFPSMVAASEDAHDTMTDEYADGQVAGNDEKTDRWLEPLLRAAGARRTLDVGCGVGQMVARLTDKGYDAYGVDLAENARYWKRMSRDPNRFAVVSPDRFVLPFDDGTFDFAFSFGVIEHVGTADGHAARLPDYYAIRSQWCREVVRVVRPGGSVILAGPNRNFPIDTSHGPDPAASRLEGWLTAKARMTIHRPWGENFLWSYGDVARYCAGLGVTIEPLSVEGFLYFSRAPFPLDRLGAAYVHHLPRALLATGFNPWMIAKITKVAV